VQAYGDGLVSIFQALLALTTNHHLINTSKNPDSSRKK
jgi:hypothetical protein